MLISTTARYARHCMEIITYRVATVASGQDFQNTLCPAVSYFLDFEQIQREKNELSCAALKTIVLRIR